MTKITKQLFNQVKAEKNQTQKQLAKKYGVSIIATLIALYQNGVTNIAADWQTNAALLIGIFITSSITYNNIVK